MEGRERLTASLYKELRQLAAGSMSREREGHTLDPTALLHEAWVRASTVPLDGSSNSARLRGLMSRMFHRVLVDHARSRNAAKRGGGAHREPMLPSLAVEDRESVSVLRLHEALDRLRRRSPRQAKIVEYRFFGGLSALEVAELLGISADSVKREWRFARAWLHRELKGEVG